MPATPPVSTAGSRITRSARNRLRVEKIAHFLSIGYRGQPMDLRDLLLDARHYARANGIDFLTENVAARDHYEAECEAAK